LTLKNPKEIIQVVDANMVNMLNEGYTSMKWDDVTINSILSARYPKLRKEAEPDDSMRQLVVYITVYNEKKEILVYPRTGSEDRLHGLYSLGIGGHVDVTDGSYSDAHMNLYYDSCITDTIIREVKEEIAIDTKPANYFFGGLIKLSETPVDRVHIGFHFLLPVMNFEFEETDEIGSIKFVPREELYHMNLEGWSKAVLNSGVLNKIK